jgi:hypothetical protein
VASPGVDWISITTSDTPLYEPNGTSTTQVRMGSSKA